VPIAVQPSTISEEPSPTSEIPALGADARSARARARAMTDDLRSLEQLESRVR
jgi:hypothetical protein